MSRPCPLLKGAKSQLRLTMSLLETLLAPVNRKLKIDGARSKNKHVAIVSLATGKTHDVAHVCRSRAAYASGGLGCASRGR